MKRVLIIGGGPSGFTTAILAKNKNTEVKILERNSSSLKKLLMTGNGKCNYFNETYSISNYHSANIEKVGEFITEKNLLEVKNFFRFLGIVPKVKNGCYYPFSMQASTVKNALEEASKACGVEVINNCLVTEIHKKENGFSVICDEEEILCDVLVLACGSKACPKTGSDGMGYSFLKELGHTLVPPVPALVQLIGEGDYFKKWDGVRSEVSLKLLEDGKEISESYGEIQLTDYGLSGICVFDLSHEVSRGLLDGKKEVIQINFVPFAKDFSSWFDQYSREHSNKNIQDLLEGFLNFKLVSVILEKSSLSCSSLYSNLSKEEKRVLCQNLENFSVPIIGTKDFDSCQVCNGGVSLDEVSLSTMESLKIKDLYIVGELLDINGNCGGYNLTTCWISGLLAGKRIGEEHDSN
ncbi:MAG: aminoacetone oxidase family FAD-binding enzyme [Bacilli bacterium]|nr:aminoacetone oxidase family FAD-binding enzyme [Bacilli bacterium]